jgi:hypothetical protein
MEYLVFLLAMTDYLFKAFLMYFAYLTGIYFERSSSTSSSAQHNNKVDKKEVCEGNKQRKTTLSRKVSK